MLEKTVEGSKVAAPIPRCRDTGDGDDQVPVAELADADLIVFAGQRFRVVGEPLLSHCGWSLFDDFEMFYVVGVKSLRDGSRSSLRLRLGADVEVAKRASG